MERGQSAAQALEAGSARSTESDGRDRQRPRLRRQLVATLAVGALGVAAVFGVRWWTHPDLFGGSGGSLGMSARPVEHGQWTAGVVFPPSSTGGKPTTITFDGAPHAVVSENTEKATLTFNLCTPRKAGPTTIGAVLGTGANYCTLTPIRSGTTMTWPGRQYIVLTVTPTSPGTLRVKRVDFDYSLGSDHWYQHGTDAVTIGVTQTTR